MIRCPHCQHEEYPGALFCSVCGAHIAPAIPEGLTTDIYKTYPETVQDTTPPPFPTPPDTQADAFVAIKILSTEEIVFINGCEEFSLGRSAVGQPLVPDIDLAPYEAYKAGVSRLHASINISNIPITVQDLGSVNGTRINGKKIEPLSPKIIHHGDILTLGKMKILLLIQE
jgi:hypothetical protein